MYKIELSINLVEDGKVSKESIDVDAIRNTVCDVKEAGKELIFSSLAPLGLEKCTCVIYYTISKYGEYYDSEDELVVVDFKNHKLCMSNGFEET